MPRSRAKPALSRPMVLAAALEIIDRDGLPALTMRELGRELGVEAMSLYHYISGKDDLLDGVVEMVLTAIELPDPGLEWAEWARRFAAVYRGIAADHPQVFSLIALRPLATAQAFRPVEMSLDVMCRAGFSQRDALAAFQTLANFTSGFALEEIASAGGEGSPAITTLDPAEFPHLREFAHRPMKRDVAFARGLDIILDGLALHLASGTPSRGGSRALTSRRPPGAGR